MKIWKKGNGVQFKNSENCYGESFSVENSPLDVATITINGRYPDAGFSYNQKAHEMAFVSSGNGAVLFEDGTEQAISPGDVVYFAPQEKIAWRGNNLVIVVPCSPAFDPNKHIVEEKI